jgi:hypothetical protein
MENFLKIVNRAALLIGKYHRVEKMLSKFTDKDENAFKN